MTSGARKGSAFERKICKELSVWWAGREDVFWRTAGSGARATTRSKKQKKTAGSYGDVSVIDPVGLPLIDALVIELKCGYGDKTLHDLLDTPNGRKRPTIFQWIDHAMGGCEEAGALSWLVIHQRTRRDALVYTSPYAASNLFATATYRKRTNRFYKAWSQISRGKWDIIVFPLQELLACVDPNKLRQVLATK